MRVAQPAGTRGSLMWMQRAVAERWGDVEQPILTRVKSRAPIAWLSPLVDDDWAEYRDASFLDRLGLSDLAAALDAFWPKRGPQWDALARTTEGAVLLVEAKAYLAEFCSSGSAASGKSLARVQSALEGVAASQRRSARATATCGIGCSINMRTVWRICGFCGPTGSTRISFSSASSEIAR